MTADPTKLFAAARRDCQLGIKAFQNVASSLEAFRRLLEVRSRPEPDRVLMSALFHMAVIRYAKPFTATKTPEGKKTSYPTGRVSGAEGFTARIHEHLLRVRDTLIAHDDFSEIEPRLLGLDLTLSEDSVSASLAAAIANCCLEYPTVGIEAMTRHVAALGHALVQNLADDLARLMQVAGEHPAVAAAASRQPPRTLGTFTVPPMGTAGLAFDPATDPYMDVPRPTFEDLGIVYEYANCIAMKSQEAPIEVRRGLFVRATVGAPGSSQLQPGGGPTATQETREEPEMGDHHDWRRVLECSIIQLELLNELDPSQPRAAFGTMNARLDAALGEFHASHSLAAATAIVAIAPALLKKATEVYARPSREFQQLHKELMGALAEIRSEAQERLSTAESAG